MYFCFLKTKFSKTGTFATEKKYYVETELEEIYMYMYMVKRLEKSNLDTPIPSPPHVGVTVHINIDNLLSWRIIKKQKKPEVAGTNEQSLTSHTPVQHSSSGEQY